MRDNVLPHPDQRHRQSARIGRIVVPIPRTIGNGFSAKHFSEEMFFGRMDPLLMVDHFVMTTPTFAPHLHAGLSAVTMMFEDAGGIFMNRDTLGHDVGLKAGDLYWLAAASGAAHEERPENGAWTHALQIFVDLPAHLKAESARSLHVLAEDVPVIKRPAARIRVILGESNGVAGANDTPEPMTLLDGFLEIGGRFAHLLPENHQAFVYAVSGEMSVTVDGELVVVPAEHATTIEAGTGVQVDLSASGNAHFVLAAAAPIHETFVKVGLL
jgi:redox-sensitive bicupin YhaK (pirin superfamily)